jgi:multiple sugar transport system substrate-binding protein
MIKKFKLILLIGLVLSILVLVGCKKPDAFGELNNKDNQQEDNSNSAQKDVEIEFWTWSPNQVLIDQFELDNPGIKVKTKQIDYFSCKEEYLKALSGGAERPDVIMFYKSIFGDFTLNGVLQDLLVEPFNAGKYQKDFPRWESGLSIDNKQLLSLTYSATPQVSLYRMDIMKENGFPYEPDEVAKFLENPDNILAVAEKLKPQDKFIFQWAFDLTNVVGMSDGVFDKDLNYIDYGEPLRKALDIAKTAYKNRMLLYGNLWTDEGKQAIKDNKLVMIFDVNSYSPMELENLVPEQRGLWRMTKPPLGTISWLFDSRIAMNAQSKHKEASWKFIEYVATHKSNTFYDGYSIPEYLPARQRMQTYDHTIPYLGDQNISDILYELADSMVPYKLTPMDEKAHSLLVDGIWMAAERDSNSDEDIKNIIEEINKQLDAEKRALLEAQ